MHFVSWLIAEHLNLGLKGLAGDNTLNNSEGMAIEILLKDNKNLDIIKRTIEILLKVQNLLPEPRIYDNQWQSPYVFFISPIKGKYIMPHNFQ